MTSIRYRDDIIGQRIWTLTYHIPCLINIHDMVTLISINNKDLPSISKHDISYDIIHINHTRIKLDFHVHMSFILIQSTIASSAL